MEVLGFVDENGDPSFEVANQFLNHGVFSTMSWYKYEFHGWCYTCGRPTYRHYGDMWEKPYDPNDPYYYPDRGLAFNFTTDLGKLVPPGKNPVDMLEMWKEAREGKADKMLNYHRTKVFFDEIMDGVSAMVTMNRFCWSWEICQICGKCYYMAPY